MTDKLFLHKKLNKAKLLKYGFTEKDGKYRHSRSLGDTDMTLNITVEKSGRLSATLIDSLSEEEYILHLVKGASGSYVGHIREEYEKALTDVANKCYDEEVFKEKQTKRVIAYFREKYGDELEHLWADAPDNAIVRRKDNQKWYAAILTVSRRKFGFDSDEKVEIIDLHAKKEDIPNIVDGVRYFPGFHMNKSHWITVILDDSLPDGELFGRIDQSYALGKKK